MPTHHFKNSSMLSHCEHDGADCMIITFSNGARYKYEGVPIDEYHKMTKAESAGKHFGEHVRGKYKHTKV